MLFIKISLSLAREGAFHARCQLLGTLLLLLVEQAIVLLDGLSLLLSRLLLGDVAAALVLRNPVSGAFLAPESCSQTEEVQELDHSLPKHAL